MFVTSKMGRPSVADDIFVLFDQNVQLPELLFTKPGVVRQRDRRLNPELCLTPCAVDVDMHSRLREKKKNR